MLPGQAATGRQRRRTKATAARWIPQASRWVANTELTYKSQWLPGLRLATEYQHNRRRPRVLLWAAAGLGASFPMQPTSFSALAAPARRGPVRHYVQRNIYRWHRIIGLITIIPVICWMLSGLLHPLMSNWLRPTIARESLPHMPAVQPVVPLTQVLSRHGLDGFINKRLPVVKVAYITPTNFTHTLSRLRAA